MPTPTGITWLDLLIIPAIVVAALGILWRPVRGSIRGVKWLYRQAKRAEKFFDTFFGTEEQPGVMDRLGAEESATGELRDAVADLTEEVGRQPKHIDELCEQMQRTVREERQEVVTAALTQHVKSFHAQSGAQQ